MAPGDDTAFTIPPEHPSLDGHFPGNPLVPGVVLLEETVERLGGSLGLGPAVAVAGVRFLAPVRPGDRVTIAGVATADGAFAFSAQVGPTQVLRGRARFAGCPQEGAAVPKSG